MIRARRPIIGSIVLLTVVSALAASCGDDQLPRVPTPRPSPAASPAATTSPVAAATGTTSPPAAGTPRAAADWRSALAGDGELVALIERLLAEDPLAVVADLARTTASACREGARVELSCRYLGLDAEASFSAVTVCAGSCRQVSPELPNLTEPLRGMASGGLRIDTVWGTGGVNWQDVAGAGGALGDAPPSAVVILRGGAVAWPGGPMRDLVAYYLDPGSERPIVAVRVEAVESLRESSELTAGWELRFQDEAGVETGERRPAAQLARVDAGADDCLNVRAEPSTAAAVLACVWDGTLMTLRGDAEAPAGWASVAAASGIAGYASTEFLALPDGVE